MTNITTALTANNNGQMQDVIVVAAVNPDGSIIGGVGGGPAGAATEATQLEMLMILNEINTDFGVPSEAAWSGTGPCSLIALLKAMHVQNQQIIALLSVTSPLP